MTDYLDGIIPPHYRAKVYGILGLLSLVAGAVQTSLTATGVIAPTWLSVLTNVVLYLGAGGSALARGNTAREPVEDDDPEPEPYPEPLPDGSESGGDYVPQHLDTSDTSQKP